MRAISGPPQLWRLSIDLTIGKRKQPVPLPLFSLFHSPSDQAGFIEDSRSFSNVIRKHTLDFEWDQNNKERVLRV